MRNRVLLIDDDLRLVTVLQIRLEALGYEVHTASGGADGVAAAKRNTPHVIVLDISMPGIDGYEVCRRVRADPVVRGTPIIVMSAIAHEAARHAAREAGADLFVAKPYEAAQVLAAIRAAIDDEGLPGNRKPSSKPSPKTSKPVTT